MGSKIKLTNAELRARLVFKWKKKIKYFVCYQWHFWERFVRGECYNCKESAQCESFRKKKMFSGS